MTGADLDILILRDPRESLAKCSLTPLRGRSGIRFVDYHPERTVEAGTRLFLHTDGPVLSPEDRALAHDGLLLIDSSWRRVPKLQRTVRGELIPRRLPPLVTAYPRKSKTFVDPTEGLASIEALAACLFLLGCPRPEFLESYRWRDRFLELNPSLTAPAGDGSTPRG